jgi:hypothetical protein
MEAFKLAFDTLIVGALALLWLALVARMFFATPFGGIHIELMSLLPAKTRDAVAGILVFAIGYFLGSVVIRISEEFFDDELWLGAPAESSVRLSVYQYEYCSIHKWIGKKPSLDLPQDFGETDAALCPANQGSAPDPETKRTQLISEVFRAQEARALQAGEDKIARLREYHDQRVVLRGSAFNGLVLVVLSGFGYWACYREKLRVVISHIPAVLVLGYGFFSLYGHLFTKHGGGPLYLDPPLAEFVVILLGFAGLASYHKAGEKDVRLYASVFISAIVLTALAYLGWWMTEIRYDFQVIHTFIESSGSKSLPPV